MIVGLIFILYFFNFSLHLESEDCCPFKSVGGTLYKFVEHVSEEERKRLKCSNTCSYEQAEKASDAKYCFKPGQLQSSCEKEALGETLEKNIVALKEAKTTVRGYYGYPYRMRNIKAAAEDCTQFTVFLDQLVGLPPQSPEIVTVAANIVASDVTCTEEQELKLGQALIALEELIARAEALLAYLQDALQDATGTTAATNTITTIPYPGYCTSCPLGSVCTGVCLDGTCYNGYCTGPEVTEVTALLIAGGYNATKYWPVTDAGYGTGSYDVTTSVELLLMDTQNGQVIQSCSLPGMPEKRYEHTVDANMVCGGMSETYSPFDTCISFSGGEWNETHKLTGQRYSHSSWKVLKGVVLFGGGGGGGLYTAELVEANTGKTKKLFDLKYGFAGACAIADDNSVIITGGGWSGDYFDNVTRYNMEGYVETLPNLLLGRNSHGCTSFVQNGKKVLLVTGGFGKRSSNSVGYFDETEIFQDGQWRNVGKLPMQRKNIKCGTLNNTVFLTGGYDPSIIPRTDILTYNPDNEGWTKTSDMIVGRYHHDLTEVAWNDYFQFCVDTTTTATPLSCDSGWTLFEQTKKCYSFYDIIKDWTSALSFCKSKTTNPSANLVSIPDKTTNDFLLDTLPTITDNTEVWLGGYRENGQWVWSDGSQWNYTHWQFGKPSAGGNNDYLEFWGRKNYRVWNNVQKSYGRRILCQYDPTQ